MNKKGMKKTQDHTRRKDNGVEDVYVNIEELDKEARTNEVSTSKTPKTRSILAALILLIILFLILMAITSVLLKYYLAISTEMSHLKNYENVQQHVLQDIKAINKTLETICRTCPSGWKPIGLFCYYYSSDELSWDNARDDCIRKGSALVSIKNKEQLDLLKSSLPQNNYWIALRRAKEPGEWIWLDGSIMSFSNWRQGEPNNYNNNSEDCVESTDGLWNDVNCGRKWKYACKKGCCC